MDDSLLEAARVAPADAYGLQQVAECCRIYRVGNGAYAPGAPQVVAAFADGVRRF